MPSLIYSQYHFTSAALHIGCTVYSSFLLVMSESSDEEVVISYLMDEDEDIARYMCGKGSDQRPRKIRRPNFELGTQEGNMNIFRDYFLATPVYSEDQFKRRFRMAKPLFYRIWHKIE